MNIIEAEGLFGHEFLKTDQKRGIFPVYIWLILSTEPQVSTKPISISHFCDHTFRYPQISHQSLKSYQ